MEKVICAAIWFPLEQTMTHLPKNIHNGIVIGGRRHNEILEVFYILKEKKSTKAFQGFLTTENRFVNRSVAYELALESKQIEEGKRHKLFSEDLY